MIDIALNEGCVIERKTDARGGRAKRRSNLYGKFIDEYDNFYLFKTSNGVKECFHKNSCGIDWRIVER